MKIRLFIGARRKKTKQNNKKPQPQNRSSNPPEPGVALVYRYSLAGTTALTPDLNICKKTLGPGLFYFT